MQKKICIENILMYVQRASRFLGSLRSTQYFRAVTWYSFRNYSV